MIMDMQLLILTCLHGKLTNHKINKLLYKTNRIIPVSFLGGPMEQFEETTIERKLFDKSSQTHTPIYGILELLPLCNLNCDMCYVRLSKEEMEKQGRLRTVEEWLSLAQEMKKAGTLFLLLTGGEPLLYPHFQELYLALKKMGMIITINSNGTLINEQWANFFQENKPRRINITLYGGSDEIYQNLCHYPNGYQQAITGIRLLQEKGIDIKINGSLVKANVNERMKIIEIGESLGIPVRIDTYMCPATRERLQPFAHQSRLDPQLAAIARIEILRKEMGEETFYQYMIQTLNKVNNPPIDQIQQTGLTCRAGSCSFVINWQGMMRPCIVSTQPSINVFENNFSETWKQLVQETSQIKLSLTCTQCPLRFVCHTCAINAYLETGSYEGTPEYICSYTKKTIEILQDIYHKEFQR